MMAGRLYHYVGPEPIRLKFHGPPRGRRVGTLDELRTWLDESRGGEAHDGEIAATFVIDAEGVLRLADRRSEHVACAGGGLVLSAGEMFFSVAGDGIAV